MGFRVIWGPNYGYQVQSQVLVLNRIFFEVFIGQYLIKVITRSYQGQLKVEQKLEVVFYADSDRV